MSVSRKLIGLSVIACAVVSVAMAAQQQSGQTSNTQQAGTSMEADAPFALIELFTSEGCSSCPSADTNLEKIAADAKANGKNVYTLSYHVDYWDYLGWKDPYSAEQFTERQRSYARQFESSRIYTPQMVVNGQVEFVGSNKKLSARALEVALKIKAKASIELGTSYKDKSVTVSWTASGIETGDAIHVGLVQNEGTQKVSRGENARRQLSHVNIVRQFKTEENPGASGEFKFAVPANFQKDKFHFIALVQSSTEIKGASKSLISDAQAAPTTQAPKDSKTMEPTVKTKRVSVRKPVIQTPDQKLVDGDRFLEFLARDPRIFAANLRDVDQQWHVSYVPMLLEIGRYLSRSQQAQMISLLEKKTGNRFGTDIDKWMQWNWKQKYDQHPQYADFKSKLYRQIDPRFAEYFQKTDNATIRLDEIRWGGVRRDGIPPLKNPKMLAANDATYLADTDVVFGIELNGDARAYPKRILAWHEMFKDTIGGESVCGVY